MRTKQKQGPRTERERLRQQRAVADFLEGVVGEGVRVGGGLGRYLSSIDAEGRLEQLAEGAVGGIFNFTPGGRLLSRTGPGRAAFGLVRDSLTGAGGLSNLPGLVEGAITGRGHSAGGPLTPSLATKAAGSRTNLQAGSIALADAPGLGRFARDLLEIPSNAIPSAYATGDAAVSAIRGDTDKAERLWEDFKNTDAIALALQGRFGEALESAEEHPGILFAEVVPGTAALSRAAGFASRGGRRRPRVRSERGVPGTTFVERTHYPRGLVGELAVRAGDRRRAREQEDLAKSATEDLQRAEEAAQAGNPMLSMDFRTSAARKVDEAARLDPSLATPAGVQRRVDVAHEGKQQSRRRLHGRAIDRAVLGKRKQPGVLIDPKDGGLLQPLVSQGVVTDADDAATYLQELRQGEAALEGFPDRLRQSRQLQQELTAVLASGVDFEEVRRLAQPGVALLNELEQEAIRRGMLDPEEAVRSKLKAYFARPREGADVRVDEKGGELTVPDERAPAIRERLIDAQVEMQAIGGDIQRFELARAAGMDTPTVSAMAQRAQIRAKEVQEELAAAQAAVDDLEARGERRVADTDELVEIFENGGETGELLATRRQLVREYEALGKRTHPQRLDLRARIGETDDRLQQLVTGAEPLLPFRGESREYPAADRTSLVRVDALDGGGYRLVWASGGERLVGRVAAEDAVSEQMGRRHEPAPASAEEQARYREVLDGAANEHGLRLQFDENPDAWHAGDGAAVVPPPRSQADLAVGLHEIGHAVLGHERVPGVHRGHEGHEREAWAWALERLDEEPNPDTDVMVREGLRSYGVEDELPPPPVALSSRSIEELAFISQAPQSTAGAFNRRGDKASGLNTRTRTGQAVRQGAISTDPQIIREQARRTQSLIDADEGWRELLGEFGFRGEDGDVWTSQDRGEANELARHLNTQPGNPFTFRVVRATPWGGREGHLRAMLEDVDDMGRTVREHGGGIEHPMLDATDEALKGQGEQGPWALILDDAAERVLAHSQVSRSAGPAWRAVSQAFRRTVLPFSPTWMTGNTVESEVRAVVAGAQPFMREYRFYGQVMDALREQGPEGVALAETLELLRPAGHYGGVARTEVKSRVEDFDQSNPAVRKLFVSLMRLRQTPGPKQVANGFRRYQDFVFDNVNAGLESQFTRALAGKYMLDQLDSRQRRLIAGRVGQKIWPERARRVAAEAVEEAARGMRDTAKQQEMADFVREAYGQYESFSPQARKVILNYTPFLAWSRNALRFLAVTMPLDHPAMTASAVALENATREWRLENNLDASQLPGFLQGSIPTPEWWADLIGGIPGAPLRLGRYTPLSLLNDPAALAGLVLPQVQGVLDSLNGVDFTGRKLRNEDGTDYTDDQKYARAVREFFFSTVPVLSQVSRGFDKEGNAAEKARQVLNPFEPVVRPDQQPVEGDAGGDFSEDEAEVLQGLEGGADDGSFSQDELEILEGLK